MTPAEAIVVLCAAPDDFDAKELAKALLEESLAACVQVTHAPYLAWLAAETASPAVIGRDNPAE